MKIKANRNLYKGILVAFSILIIFIETLAYFLGFDVNSQSLLYYFMLLLATTLFFLLLFLIIDTLNKKYIIFDEEKIIEQYKDKEKIVLYFDQILYTKYHNRVDLFLGVIDFGYVEIVYKIDPKDKDAKHISLHLPKKHYKKVFNK